MKPALLSSSVLLLSLGVMPEAIAGEGAIGDRLAQINPLEMPEEETNEAEPEEEIVVKGQKPRSSGATPLYVITEDEIQKQGANSAAELLRGLPGFAINDVGFGADIHTGTYYRGSTINQNLFLLNGRPLGTNINTYHGATDLNSIPVEALEKVELSSGTASTLYGSEAFGGIVNFITKAGSGPTKFDAQVQFGSYGQENYRTNLMGAIDALSYVFSFEKFSADNRYRVPFGAANRGPDGRLFNGDTDVTNYYGGLVFKVDPRNTLSLDAYKITSRRGLLYFGFPLQRDRLNHDALSLGLSWRALIGSGEDSILTTTIGLNQDDFNTYGPTQAVFYRQGKLDSTALTARVEHNWQVASNYNLRYGLDLQNQNLEGESLSTVPQLVSLNEREKRDRLNAALFALNTWKITDTLQAEFGLRQNFNTEFGDSLNPSLGARWDITSNLALRGSWVSVRRNPGLDQLYIFDTVHNWLPNPNLEPETGSAWTAGIDLRISANLTGQLTYFGSHLSDRLGVVAGRWENIDQVNTNGLEASLRWEITPQLSTFINYTYTDARIESGVEKGLQLSTVPFSVGQAGIGYDSGGWQINLYATYSSGSRRALFTNPGDNPRDFSPSWLNLDLNARVPLFKNVGLLVYLENLADRTYEKANRIYQPGLTFRLGLTASF
jgi:vitamin B12 transporter